jgi:hypothetical protein
MPTAFDELDWEQETASNAFDEVIWTEPESGNAFDSLEWEQPEYQSVDKLVEQKFPDVQQLPVPESEANTTPWQEIKQAGGEAWGALGNIARAIPADVASGISLLKRPENQSKNLWPSIPAVAGAMRENMPYSVQAAGNIPAAIMGEPLPIDKTISEASSESIPAATVGKISQGIAATAPMAVIGGLPKAMQKAALIAFTTKMISDAPEVATQLGDELGKPKDQQDPDKVSSLVSDAIQITGFTVLGGTHLAKSGLDSAIKFSDGKIPRGTGIASPEPIKAEQVQKALPPEQPQKAVPVEPMETVVKAEELAKPVEIATRPPKNFTDVSTDELVQLWHRYRADYSRRPTEALDARIEQIGVELAHRSGQPEGYSLGTRGFRPVESKPVVKAEEFAKPVEPTVPPAETTAVRDWDVFNEKLRDDLDSWNNARESGRRNYELMDVADRFVEFARTQPANRGILDIYKDFAKTDSASAGQLRKLKETLKAVEPKAPPTPLTDAAATADINTAAEPAKGEKVISPYTDKEVTANDFPGSSEWTSHAQNIGPSVWNNAEGLKGYLADLNHDSKFGIDNSHDLKLIADVEKRIAELTKPTPPTEGGEVGPGTGIGPGSAAKLEFEQAAIEANKGLWQRFANWIKQHRTPDEAAVKQAIGRKDIMPGRHWANSPEFIFRKDPVAAPLVSNLVEAQLRLQHHSALDDVHFQEVTKTLGRGRAKTDSLVRITKALREYERTGDETAMTAPLTPVERGVAVEIRRYFDEWRTRVQERMVSNIADALPDARGNAVRDILGGADFETAAKANKLRGAGRTAVKLALDEISQARKWGPERYVTHAEQGSWRLVTEEGHTVAIAETKVEAFKKAEEYLKQNPKSGQLTLDDSFDPGVNWPTQMTPPSYGRLLNQLREATGKTAKELQAALRQGNPGIVIRPTNKYNRFMLKRRNVLAGEENIMDVLPSYVYSMWKKYQLDPVLKESRSTLSKLTPESRIAIEDLIKDVKGQKYVSDKIVDHLMTAAADKVEKATGFVIPITPFGMSRGVNQVRNIAANLKLGYRPVSVIVNRLGGIHHTWTKTGFKDYMEGRRWLKTEEGKRLVKENEAEMGLQAAFVTEGRISKEQAWYSPLGLFQKMEHFNRPEAFGAFYIQATKRLGLKGDAAIEHALKSTRFSQFIYATASLPKVMRSPVGRLFLQFKPYLVKEFEFISSLKPAEAARYLTGFMALGGPRAAIVVLKTLPIIGAIGLIPTIEQWLNKNAPQSSRGVPGLLGADVSSAVAPQLPTQTTDWIGAALSDYFRLWRDVIAPTLKGETKDFSNLKEWATRTAPAAFYMDQLVESVMDKQGWVKDERGRRQFKPSKLERGVMALGAMPIKRSQQQVEQRYLLEMDRIMRQNRKQWVDKLTDAVQDNDSEAINRLMQHATDFGFTKYDEVLASFRQNMKSRNLDPSVRLQQRLLKANRQPR